MGFIVSKFWVIIGTVLVFLTKIDYFRNKKIIYLFLTIFSLIATGLFLLHPDNPLMEKIYAVLVVLMNVFNLVELIKYRKSKEKTFVVEDKITFTIEEKKMFEDALAGAQKGDLMCIFNLGYYYRNGTGTSINLKKSREMFLKLCSCDIEFLREEGKKELAITEKMIKDKHKEMRDVIKDGIDSIIS